MFFEIYFAHCAVDKKENVEQEIGLKKESWLIMGDIKCCWSSSKWK